jgi:putative ABC transport system permease protein
VKRRLPNASTVLVTGLRGLRHRWPLTVASVLLVALAVASAVLAPMFASAATMSFLVTTLRASPPYLTGVTLDYQPRPGTGLDTARAQAQAPLKRLDLGAFSRPELSLWGQNLDVDTWTTPGVQTVGSVTSSPRLCQRLVIVTGRCPTKLGETVALKADAALNRTRLGDRLRIEGLPQPLTVVGTYRLPTAGSRWYDPARFTSAPPHPVAGGALLYEPAPFVVNADTIEELQVPWIVRMDFRLLVPASTTPADLRIAVHESQRIRSLTNDTASGHFDVAVGSALRSVIHETETRRLDAQAAVLPAAVSLIAVALVLLLRVLSAAMESRRPELALAALRGIGRRQLWALGLGEPLLVLACATPIGVVMGAVGAHALARSWLVPKLPVPLDWSSALFGAAVLVAALGITVATLRSAAAEPLNVQLASVRRPTRAGRWSLLWRLGLLAATASVLVSTTLSSSGRGLDGVGLLLPILLAASAGLLTMLLIAAVARWWARSRAGSRAVAGYLAVRTIARRREGAGVVLPITAALAIALFTGAIYTTAANWRTSVAATSVGAAKSFTVRLPMSRAVALTDRLDPRGRWLMAVGVDTSAGFPVALVDASRMTRVLTWPSSWTPQYTVGQIAQLLGPTKRPLMLTGKTLQMTVTNRVGHPRGLLISVDVRTTNGTTKHFFLGPFGRGRDTRSAKVTGCVTGCVVTGVTLSGPAGLPRRLDGRLRINHVRLDGHSVPYFVGVGWRSLSDRATYGVSAVRGVESAGPSLEVDLHSGHREALGPLVPEDIPPYVPVLIGPAAQPNVTARRGDILVVRTGVGGPLALQDVGSTESTPSLGPAGMVADYTVYSRNDPGLENVTSVRILADADAPRAVLNRLAAAGVTSPTTLQSVERKLSQEPYALALKLYLVVTVLVLLLALAGLCVNLGVQLPGRRRDAASLRVVGVRRGSIFVAAATEHLVLLASAAIAGVMAGAAAQAAVVRTLTLGYGDSITTPRVISALDMQAVLQLAAFAVAVLFVVAVGLGALTIRSARTAALRETPE